jgi:hypothetical protein
MYGTLCAQSAKMDALTPSVVLRVCRSATMASQSRRDAADAV